MKIIIQVIFMSYIYFQIFNHKLIQKNPYYIDFKAYVKFLDNKWAILQRILFIKHLVKMQYNFTTKVKLFKSEKIEVRLR